MDVFCYGSRGIIEGVSPSYQFAGDICPERTVETIKREATCSGGVLLLAGINAEELIAKI